MESTRQSARRMRVPLFVIAALFAMTAVSGAAIASPPQVKVMITGKTGIVVPPVSVKAAGFTTAVLGKRCAIAEGTPLAALRATTSDFHLKDFGSCSMRTADSGSLYTDTIAKLSGAGMAGWSYKVDNASGTAGAADPSGPFGRGPLKSGSRVLWFWCQTYPCQRSLALVVPVSAGLGSQIRVKVRGYDDNGRYTNAAGVRVSLGMSKATTGTDGYATIRTPSTAGMYAINAIDISKPGGYFRAPAFPETVIVRLAG